MARHGANTQGIAIVMYVVKLTYTIQVDQNGRLGQPQCQQRHQTLATGKKLGIVPEVCQ
jgi:hypothetical protein